VPARDDQGVDAFEDHVGWMRHRREHDWRAARAHDGRYVSQRHQRHSLMPGAVPGLFHRGAQADQRCDRTKDAVYGHASNVPLAG
jgi:hypothetical protein